ncbi:Holliday junction ATP-dependent DNA helicase RuvA [Leptospira biflexa]|uniref:Holliday junction branch migration complex subunit RuvA n=2 Tax=Leptospira biflexa serovar Patoc TaxID=145259 RepID=RUVA_LEPBP|nr:Holliday junction branch migration protein RuvA [Leptospira biflexa]B0SGZ5.1 RecName: Full=Holliday junction branch migration complex subunit RuvA [Leptospira biflexa serovar Patoc strain 'Patoc 1 (Ames)']B0SQF0.1 RecName: Full=Holliday junction branch migration complex subunit RuvA [Leptospira biflexa serovar Patoc strain 'Patoc 1 (Paris)']ABZ93962.1 Holliday junction specific DNA binding protein [Leptospira biflexa serovar Patoc strain 'Patoc 1 (Ames)']ABZ97608.1 Holliday junction DNA heli
MIASLRGKLLQLEIDRLVVEVSGVGYEVMIPFPLHLECKDKLNTEIYIHTFHSITDRGQRLFGFGSKKDRESFELIKSLHGIGELTALKILSFFQADDLYQIAKADDKKTLEKIPKVKGKTSEKILFEIKQNLKKFEMFLNEGTTESSFVDRETDLATLALIQLGFDEKSATKQVADAKKLNPGLSASDIVKQVITGTR